jgi:hypothetical protein
MGCSGFSLDGVEFRATLSDDSIAIGYSIF